jgi:hypothetical protein
MSIKKLFGKSFSSYESASVDVESPTFIDNTIKERETYLPPIDFASASNFVKYGSAQMYYEKSIARIYGDYPYDGSKAEKIMFHQSSSYLDRWMYEIKYPKTTGFVTLGKTSDYTGVIVGGYGKTNTNEYIRTWGGLHTASVGMDSNPIQDTFGSSVVYDAANNRTQNWAITPISGTTVEFWLQKPAFDVTDTEREVIVDLWNGKTPGTEDYARFLLEIDCTSAASAGCVELTYQSGTTTGVYRQTVCSTNVTLASLQNWHYYALSVVSASAGGVDVRFYKNGAEDRLKSSLGTWTGLSSIGSFDGLITGFIGAVQHKTTSGGSTVPAGSGKFSGSLDEFRFWKTRRTSRQIELNWFRQVGGGANTDDFTTNLGVYYKFNEGISNSAIDSTILDYSGRLANGAWIGYTSNNGQRSTRSAMNLSAQNLTESGNPIIYPTHPDVVALKSEMSTSGSNYDNEYGSSFYTSLPNWVLEEDGQGNQNLKNLSQILSSYFDTLYSQITALSTLKQKGYLESQYKAPPFARALLEDKGFITKDLFVDSKIVELFSSADFDAIKFQENLTETKNLIYLNIYNNLDKIYKSKGTEKSIRNLIRCFGVDDEIIKLNMYTDGGIHYFTDKAKASSVKKKYLNFNNSVNFSSTIFQTTGSVNNPLTFISGSDASDITASWGAFTLEADVVIPYKKSQTEIGYFSTPFLSSSIFGFHEANEADPDDYTWESSELADLQIYLTRHEVDSKNARVTIKNQAGTINWASDYISEIYDNDRWNFAIRVKPDTYPYAGNVATSSAPTYTLDVYAVNYNFAEIENLVTASFSLNAATGEAYVTRAKRVYAGAHLINFTGAVDTQSDVQIGAVRAWYDYLPDSTIQQHNLDPTNYGTRKTYEGSNIFLLSDTKVGTEDLTILNWDFDTVTASNASGEFTIDDLTSGSSTTLYGWMEDIIHREYKGLGRGFQASSEAFIENEFVYAQKKELPEISFTNDNVFIKTEKDINFITDDDVSDNFYLLEKSLNQVVSEEMLKMFSTVHEFSNLFGRPVDLYRTNYKRLEKVRETFYQKVEQDTDLEVFLNYYKWIDSSVSKMIYQLIPATVNFGPGIMDVVESHILERNKYQRRVGLLDTIESTEGTMLGINDMTYSWKYGHAPVGFDTGVNEDNNENCLWQKQRSERNLPSDVSADREQIRKALVNQTNATSSTLSTITKAVYQGSTYVPRALGLPYKLSLDFSDTIHGGTNYNKQKDREFLRTATWIHGSNPGAPVNIMTVGLGAGYGIVEKRQCSDVYDPNKKDILNLEVEVGKYADANATTPLSSQDEYVYKLASHLVWPFNMVSGTLNSGYNKIVHDDFKSTAIITNLHSDTTDYSNEIPMQGPFTEAHVGGSQNRHVALNKYNSGSLTTPAGQGTPSGLQYIYTRPEAWALLFGPNPLHPSDPDGAMGFVGPDYGSTYPDTSKKLAIYYRGLRAKRPVNIRNIQSTTASSVLGNYQHEYETLSTFSNQKYYFRHYSGSSLLPDSMRTTLAPTTHYMTLVGQAPFLSGNVFGVANNNRQPDTGSLQIRSGIAEVFSSGSFEMTGAYVVGAKATGNLNIQSSRTRGFYDASDSDLNYFQFGGEYFKIDNSQAGLSDSGTNYYIRTGSTSTDYWDNTRTKLTTVGKYSHSYTVPDFTGSSLQITGATDLDHGFTLSASSPQVPTELASDSYSWVFNLQFKDQAIPSRDQYLMLTSASSDGVAQELYIEASTGDLKYKLGFTGGQVVTYTTASFLKAGGEVGRALQSDIGGLVNITLVHQFTSIGPSVSDIKLFVGGMSSVFTPNDPAEQAFTKVQTGGAIGNQQLLRNDVRDLYLLSQLGKQGTNFEGWISTVAVFETAFSTAVAGNVWNNGFYKDYTNCNGVGSNLISQWDFLDGKLRQLQHFCAGTGDIIPATAGSSNRFDLTGSLLNPLIAQIYPSGAVPPEEYALFEFEAAITGSTSNSAYSFLDTPTTFNYYKDPTAAGISGGRLVEGLLWNNSIQVGSYTITTTNTGPGANDVSVTGSSSEIWDMMVYKFSRESEFSGDCHWIERYPLTPGRMALISLTASVGSPVYDYTITRNNAGNQNPIGELNFPVSTNMVNGSAAVPDRSLTANDNVIEIPRTDLTSSQHTITTRFSAPGGPEVNSRGYLDVATGQYSVHNSMNFRNLPIRSSGSGQDPGSPVLADSSAGTIRVNSNIGRAEGLQTMLRRHCGKFGADGQHGSVTADTYVTVPAFYKQHRNTLVTPTIKDGTLRKAIRAPASSNNDVSLKNLTFNQPLNWNSGFSVSFWVKADLSSNNCYVCRANPEQTGSSSFHLYLNSTGQFVMNVVNVIGSISSTITWYNQEIKTDQWTFVTITWNGNLGTSPVGYFNGESKAPYSNTFSVTNSGEPKRNFCGITLFDKYSSNAANELQGSLTDFALWNRVLTPSEVQELYEDDGKAIGVFFNGALFDYWRLGTESVLSGIAVGGSISNGTVVPSDMGNNGLTAGDDLVISEGPYVIHTYEDKNVYNNMSVVSSIPASTFQYSWINATISGSNGWMNGQRLRGYAPKSGEMRIIGGGSPTHMVSAINFPTASSIYGE